jgi:UDP-N-acetylmuramyl pentapeptide phosphotransferase/UDP-N-acetylglucosamine-1-phosphate transferase
VEKLTSLTWIISIFLSFLISLLTIKLAIKILAKTKTIDIPNERSNHIRPTPKGAGIGIIASLLIVYYIFFPITDFIFSVSILLLCIISFINDNKQISIFIRLLIQIILAIIVLFYWPPLENLSLLETIIPSWLELIITLLFIIWMTNLFNFMDGIDGISCIQCIIIGFGAGFCLFLSQDINKIENVLAGFFIGSGTAFLIWNWQPSKVFLGDAGSVPIGFINAILFLLLFQNGLWYVAIILNSYYLADSSITLLKRILKKEKPWQAHKSHFYQKAIQNGYSHSKVCLIIATHGALLIVISFLASINPNFIIILFSILISSLSTIYLLYYLNKTPKSHEKDM